MFQLTVAHGQTFVFSHHAYTANAASVWCHPLMQQKNRLGDFIKPVPAEMLKSMEMPSPQALQIIRDDRLEPALLKLRDSVYTFLGLFSLAVDIDHHSDILAQLGLNDLLAIIHFHHEPTKVEKIEDVIASFVSANGSDNALLDVLMDYYANVLEFSERAKLNELKMQMNALDAISRAKSSAQRVHGLFGGASPKTPASDTINRSASPGIAKVANTFDDDSGDLRTKPYAKR